MCAIPTGSVSRTSSLLLKMNDEIRTLRSRERTNIYVMIGQFAIIVALLLVR